MNGRAYDYNLGRFLSVDPIIQSPGNSQSLNPYSYIMNNPLAGTDPTGYCSKELGSNICSKEPSSVQVSATLAGNMMAKAAQAAVRGNGAQQNQSSVPVQEAQAVDIKGQQSTITVQHAGGSVRENQNNQGMGAIDAIKAMANIFWDYRGEILTGAVDGAADAITENTGGLIDGDSVAEITGVRAGTDTIIAVSQGDVTGSLSAGAGVLVGKAKVVKNLLEKTPLTNPELFKPVSGCKAKCNIDTGEIWEKDLLHKNQPHYEVYKNKKYYDKGKRDRAVWEDGRLKQEFKK